MNQEWCWFTSVRVTVLRWSYIKKYGKSKIYHYLQFWPVMSKYYRIRPRNSCREHISWTSAAAFIAEIKQLNMKSFQTFIFSILHWRTICNTDIGELLSYLVKLLNSHQCSDWVKVSLTAYYSSTSNGDRVLAPLSTAYLLKVQQMPSSNLQSSTYSFGLTPKWSHSEAMTEIRLWKFSWLHRRD